MSPAEDQAHWQALQARYRQAVDPVRLQELAGRLGVGVDSLERLQIGWNAESRGWTFPMVDAKEQIRGIRVRTDSGMKFSVRGGHEGIFVPLHLVSGDPLVICEGPTDTAACLDWEFDALGRSSSMGCRQSLVAWVGQHQRNEVVILADRDRAGQDGAQDLVQRLVIHVLTIRILTPPVKDARAWRQARATRQDVLDAIAKTPIHRLSMPIKENGSARE